MPPKEFEDDELAGLSDDERAALEDDGDEDEQAEQDADEAADTDEDESDEADGNAKEDDDAEEGDDDEEGEAAPVEADAAAPEPEAAEPPAAAAEAHQKEFRAELHAGVPDDLGAKIADVDARAKALLEEFQGGGMEFSDYVARNQAIIDERISLKLLEERAKWVESQNEAQRAQRWAWEQERFFGQESAKIYHDPIMRAAFNASIQHLAAENAGADKPSIWYLEQADKLVRERMGVGSAPAQEKPKAAVRKPDLTNIPKTLANVPAAEIPESAAGEFAYLDKLFERDPMAYERALAKLTPEQEARFLGAM